MVRSRPRPCAWICRPTAVVELERVRGGGVLPESWGAAQVEMHRACWRWWWWWVSLLQPSVLWT